jgi:hypothetical protein
MDEDLRVYLEAMKAELLGQFNERTEQILTSISGIRDDLTVLDAANDRTRKAGDNTRDEGREIAGSLANIERILLKHSTRLDELERRLPRPPP